MEHRDGIKTTDQNLLKANGAGGDMTKNHEIILQGH